MMVPRLVTLALVLASASTHTFTTHRTDYGGGEDEADEEGDDRSRSRRYTATNSELEKLDQLFRFGDREQYDRRQTPSYFAAQEGGGVGTASGRTPEGMATWVHIEMYIRSFGSINPIQMDYTVDLYLRQRWLELRFMNNSLTRPIDLNDPRW
ncbi:gamma-aminobutyric acid receptor subunit gamma-2-like [Homarus americanus]|uniref:gamma-aminobutyric acid receptor subunit gamma-2-like n=1 Tax=Homarus americanus TaxID=6706 RepID=UPI001C43E0EA|nr:gamma-aminobutyric acid receptor subunit gamma-2-like [Homarus americanus]